MVNLTRPFKQIWKVFDGIAGGKYYLIDTLPKWHEFFSKLKTQTYVACDSETSGLAFPVNHLVGLSFSWGVEHCYYVALRHTKLVKDPTSDNLKKPKWIEERSDEKQINFDDIKDDLIEFYGDPKRFTIWHNWKYDAHFLKKENIEVKGPVHDTRLMRNLINENESAKLKDLSKILIHPNADKWEKMVYDFRIKFAREHKIKKDDVHYGFIPLDIMTPYASSDVHYTYILYKKFLPDILDNSYLRELYVNVELPLARVLFDMEEEGVFLDRQYLKETGPKMLEELNRLKETICKKLGKTINIESNIQVIPLFQKMGIQLTKQTETGRYSLDKEVLEILASKYDVCSDIKNFRTQRKLHSTYVINLLSKSSADSRIHCEYNQNVVTGRMSSKNPNLQNIPRGNTTIRKAFVPPKGVYCTDNNCKYFEKTVEPPTHCPICGSQTRIDDNYFLLLIDYSQIEVRMTGHYSQDPILLNVYNKTGEDVHLRTCCEVFGHNYHEAEKILEDSTHPKYKEIKADRQIAKMINFLIIYGGGAKSLSVKISTPTKQYTPTQCSDFIKKYLQKYKGVQKWAMEVKLEAQKYFEIQNAFGRYRHFPGLANTFYTTNDPYEENKRERAYRQAVNYLIQGTCADLFKIALIRVHHILKGYKSSVVMPIHDEIIFYYHKEDLHLLPQIIKEMQDFDFRIPIIAELSYSTTSWADKKSFNFSA
jgi:DNA polymerase-1